MIQTIYIAGRILGTTDLGNIWDILGACTTEEAARSLCFDSFCFVGEISLNKAQPPEPIAWRGGVQYPYIA